MCEPSLSPPRWLIAACKYVKKTPVALSTQEHIGSTRASLHQKTTLLSDTGDHTKQHAVFIAYVAIAWWRHQMEKIPRYWPFVRGIHRSPENSPHKGQWRGALLFSLICVWINGWVNNCEAGDLRRHLAHYDVIVMCLELPEMAVGQPYLWAKVARQTYILKFGQQTFFLRQTAAHCTPYELLILRCIWKVIVKLNQLLFIIPLISYPLYSIWLYDQLGIEPWFEPPMTKYK